MTVEIEKNNVENLESEIEPASAVEDVKFDMETAIQSLTIYKLNQIVDGVVVEKRSDGLIFNIGGKLDAFLPKADFEDFSITKSGQRFKVTITSLKNDEGMVQVSKKQADDFLEGNLQVEELKIGKTFSFVINGIKGEALTSKLGEFEILVHKNEISEKPIKDFKRFLNKRFEGLVVDIDKENKTITASVKMLEQRAKQNIELAFWNSIFVNKLVSGTIVKELDYGVLVEVNGVTCFCHISQISHSRIAKPTDVLKLGTQHTFKVIEVDHDNKRVSLSYKALQPTQKQNQLSNLQKGEVLKGKVVSLLDFGAIVEVDDGLTGLLHISEASAVFGTFIKDIVKKGEELEVVVKNVDLEKQKLSLALKEKR